MQSHHRLNKKIKDDKFTPDEIGQYNLSMQLNTSIFRICITDSETNRCLFIEDYTLENILYPEQLIEQLNHIFEQHEVLQAGFWKTIKLAIKELDFSLIPTTLFDKQYAKDYLKINSGKQVEEEDIFYYSQKSTDAISIFSANKKIINWISAHYPGKAITVIHHTTPLIEGILYDSKGESEKRVFAHVEQKVVTIVVRSAKGLEFCNSFYFSSSEDFIYFVLFVYHQLNLNPEKNVLQLFGEITTDSDIYKKLLTYIRNVSFGDKPTSMQFGYQFDELFDHRFFDLYSMHFCD